MKQVKIWECGWLNQIVMRPELHLESIFRAAHLMGVCGEGFVPKTLTADYSLDFFDSFYVNKYVDHHAFEIAF